MLNNIELQKYKKNNIKIILQVWITETEWFWDN